MPTQPQDPNTNAQADPCITHGQCNQHCNQGRTCPRAPHQEHKAAHIAKVGAQRPSNVHAIHPQLHARDDAWLTTPGQLERTEDERTGRVATVYDNILLGIAAAITVAAVAFASGYVYVRWGDLIGNAITSTLADALIAWGRVWT